MCVLSEYRQTASFDNSGSLPPVSVDMKILVCFQCCWAFDLTLQFKLRQEKEVHIARTLAGWKDGSEL